MTEESETEFTRRKFTITEYLDDVLISLAETHYQGNVSLCLRAAIEDHRTTLKATGEAQSISRLLTHIEHITENQDQLEQQLTELQNQTQEQTPKYPHPDHFPQDNGMSQPASLVLHEIKTSKQPPRFQDLRETLDLPLEDLQQAIGHLIDRAQITQTDTHPPRYQPAGKYQTRDQ